MESYLISVGINICAFIFSSFLLYNYISKSKSSKVNKKYIVALFIIFGICILGFIFPYTFKFNDKYATFNVIISRLFVFMLYIYSLMILLIVLMAISPKHEVFDGNKKYEKILIYSLVVIFTIMSIVLDTKIVGGNNLPYNIIGSAMTVSHLIAFVFSLIEIVFLNMYSKNISNLNMISLYVTLTIYVIVTLLEKKYGYYYNVASLFFTALNIIAFLTFENQDYTLIDKINKDKQEIDESSNKKSSFQQYISHRVRSQVSTILGYSDIYNKNDNISDEYYLTSVDNITNATNHLIDLYDSMEDLINIKNDKITVKNEKYPISDIIYYIDYSYSNKKFNIIYDTRLPKLFMGDAKLISKVLVYLINTLFENNKNRVLFEIKNITEGGFANVTFRISTDSKVISLTDYKRNIDLDNINYEENSTNLRIAMSKKIVDLLGGTLEFNDTNIGCEYIIEFKQQIIDYEPCGDLDLKTRVMKGVDNNAI